MTRAASLANFSVLAPFVFITNATANASANVNLKVNVNAGLQIVDQARELQRKRDNDRRLTQQQNQEFEEAMQRDQQRKAQERAAREAARTEARAAEAAAAAEREQAAEAAASKENRLEQAQKIVAEELGAEPSEKPYATIRFQLPNGTRFGRRFDRGATFRQLRAFVVVQLAEREMDIARFCLFHTSKRRTFNEDDDDSVTLQDAGLSADVLLVRDLDA